MSEDKLQRIKEIIGTLNDTLTRDEFFKALKTILEYITRLESTLLKKVDMNVQNEKQKMLYDFKQAAEDSIRFAKEDNVRSVNELRKMALEAVNSLVTKHESKLSEIDTRLSRVRDGKDGKSADETRVISEVLKRIVVPPPDDTRLKELEKAIEEVRQSKRIGGGFSKIAMESKFIDDETPSGTVNGSNTIFTLAFIPNPPASVKVYVNGARMRITSDYTLSSKTITFIVAPPTDSIILVDYRT